MLHLKAQLPTHHAEKHPRWPVGPPQRLLYPVLLHRSLDLPRPPPLPLVCLLIATSSSTATTNAGASSAAGGNHYSGGGCAGNTPDGDKLKDYSVIHNNLHQNKSMFLSFDLEHDGEERVILKISRDALKTSLTRDQS